MTAQAVSTAAHIPAWKKLGLKLKYANDSPAETTAELSDATDARESLHGVKRKRSDDNSAGKDVSDSKSSRSALTSHDVSSQKSQHAANGQSGLTAKKKSVSFATEAKTEDGDGVQQIYTEWPSNEKSKDASISISEAGSRRFFVDGESERPVKDDSSRPTSDSSTAVPKQDSLLEQKPRKAGKEKGKKKKKQKSSTRDSETATDILSYLDEYINSPSTWKFSKTIQKHLLKNVFSSASIPSSYDRALLSYLKGLASKPARSRIREQALKIQQADIQNPGENPAEQGMGVENKEPEQTLVRKKAELEAAVARMMEVLHSREEIKDEWEESAQWTRRMQDRRRAEIALLAVGGEEEEVQPNGLSNDDADHDNINVSKSSTPHAPSKSLRPPIQSSHTRNEMSIELQPHSKHPIKIPQPQPHPHPQGRNQAQAQTQAQDQPKRKRHHRNTKKRRTTSLLSQYGIPDDFSSSSSSSSSSEDSGTAGPGSQNKKSKAKQKEKRREQEDVERLAREQKAEQERRERDRQREDLAARREQLEALRRALEEGSGSSSDSEG